MSIKNKITITKKIFLAAVSFLTLFAIAHAPGIPVNSTTLPLSPDADNDKAMEYRGFVNDTFGNVVYSKPGLCDTASPPGGGCTSRLHEVICYHNPDRVWVAGNGTYDSACPVQNIFIKPDCDDTDNAYYPQALPMSRDIKNLKVATTAAFNRNQVNECGVTPAGEFNIFDNLQLTLRMDKKYKCFVNEATYSGGFLPGATNKTFTAKAYVVANGREFEIGNLVFTAKEDENLDNPSRDNEYTTEITGSPSYMPTGFIADKTAQRELLNMIDHGAQTKIRLKWQHAYKGAQSYEVPFGMANGIEKITNLRAKIEPTYAAQTYNQTKVLPVLPVNLSDSLLVKTNAEGSIRCHTLPAVQLETAAGPLNITPDWFTPQPGTISRQTYVAKQVSGSSQVELVIFPRAPISVLEPLLELNPGQYGAAMKKIKNEANIPVSVVAKSPDFSKPSNHPTAEYPIVKVKETAQVPATTCKQVAGNGTKKIVFIAGKSADIGTAQLEALIKDVKNNYIEMLDPMKTYKNDFSYHIDEIIQDDTSWWLTDPLQRPTYGTAYIRNDAIKDDSSCMGAFLYVFWNGRTWGGYAYKNGKLVVINIKMEEKDSPIPSYKYRTVLHETGHAIGGLSDEYVTGGFRAFAINEFDRGSALPNCTWNPEKTYKINGKMYGDTNWIGCNYTNTITIGSKIVNMYRPSEYSVMLSNALNTEFYKFSAFDCAYMAAAIKGGKADDYFEACMRMDTIKPQAQAKSTQSK